MTTEIKALDEIPGITEIAAPFASPPHAAEVEIESHGGIRHRVRVEGQTGEGCVDRVLRLLEVCREKNFAHALSRES